MESQLVSYNCNSTNGGHISTYLFTAFSILPICHTCFCFILHWLSPIWTKYIIYKNNQQLIEKQQNNWPTPEEPRYRPTPIPIPITVRVRTKETPPAISNPLLLGEEVLVKASKNSGEDNIFQIFWNSCFKKSSDEKMLLFTNHLALRKAEIAKS